MTAGATARRDAPEPDRVLTGDFRDVHCGGAIGRAHRPGRRRGDCAGAYSAVQDRYPLRYRRVAYLGNRHFIRRSRGVRARGIFKYPHRHVSGDCDDGGRNLRCLPCFEAVDPCDWHHLRHRVVVFGVRQLPDQACARLGCAGCAGDPAAAARRRPGERQRVHGAACAGGFRHHGAGGNALRAAG